MPTSLEGGLPTIISISQLLHPHSQPYYSKCLDIHLIIQYGHSLHMHNLYMCERPQWLSPVLNPYHTERESGPIWVWDWMLINFDHIRNLCTYVHTYIHTYIHTYKHTYIYTYVHTYIHRYIHMFIHTYCTYVHGLFMYIHTYIDIYICSYIHTVHMYMGYLCTESQSLLNMHTYTQMYVHVRHACMHICTHVRTCHCLSNDSC